MTTTSLATIDDRDLLDEVARLADLERNTTAELIELLGEVDARRLYLGAGYSSMFTWCTGTLCLSEHAVYERITAARLSRRLPIVLERLKEGAVTLTNVGLLSKHLTADNCDRLLDSVRHKTKSEVERLVACIDPKPDVPASVRKLPSSHEAASTTLGEQSAVALELTPLTTAGLADKTAYVSPAAAVVNVTKPRAVVAPLSSERYLLKVTISADAHETMRRAQALLRHAMPSADPAAVVERAFAVLVEQLEKARFAASSKPRASRPASGTRSVPAAVKREVWARDGGQCAFVGNRGRCSETAFLEFHHVVPVADRGTATVENISLRCRGHNRHEADKWFAGELPMANSV